MKILATVVDPEEEPWPFNAPSDLLVEKSHRGKKTNRAGKTKLPPPTLTQGLQLPLSWETIFLTSSKIVTCLNLDTRNTQGHTCFGCFGRISSLIISLGMGIFIGNIAWLPKKLLYKNIAVQLETLILNLQFSVKLNNLIYTSDINTESSFRFM